MWGGELEGAKYLLGSDASLNGAVSLCDCPLCGKKMRTRGSPLFSIDFPETVKCEPHSRLDRCSACGGGLMNKETMDHGILRGIIIASSAWSRINISCCHPRDWNIQVWRGQVKEEIKARATGISLVTLTMFMENKWKQRSAFAIIGNYLGIGVSSRCSILKCIQVEREWWIGNGLHNEWML